MKTVATGTRRPVFFPLLVTLGHLGPCAARLGQQDHGALFPCLLLRLYHDPTPSHESKCFVCKSAPLGTGLVVAAPPHGYIVSGLEYPLFPYWHFATPSGLFVTVLTGRKGGTTCWSWRYFLP